MGHSQPAAIPGYLGGWPRIVLQLGAKSQDMDPDQPMSQNFGENVLSFSAKGFCYRAMAVLVPAATYWYILSIYTPDV